MEARMKSRLFFGSVAAGLAVMFGSITPASAIMNMEQARAYCAKRAQANASANRQQIFADQCVKVLISSGKAK
jgi:hypothetical protein